MDPGPQRELRPLYRHKSQMCHKIINQNFHYRLGWYLFFHTLLTFHRSILNLLGEATATFLRQMVHAALPLLADRFLSTGLNLNASIGVFFCLSQLAELSCLVPPVETELCALQSMT